MKIFMRTGQALIGLILAAALAAAVSTWIFPGENDELFLSGIFRLSVTGIGAGMALLVGLAFSDGWIGVRKRRGGACFPGTLLHGIGFGLLPGIAIWKAFEHMTGAGKGTEIPEKIPQISFLSAEGCYLPSRIELMLALTAFGALILWLTLRKEDLPENGDLTQVSLTLWGTVRLMTGRLHEQRVFFPETPWVAAAMAAAAMLFCLLFWVCRALRQHKNTGYALICVPVLAACVTGILLQDLQLFTVNPPADLTIRAVCSLLAMKSVLCMGRVSR